MFVILAIMFSRTNCCGGILFALIMLVFLSFMIKLWWLWLIGAVAGLVGVIVERKKLKKHFENYNWKKMHCRRYDANINHFNHWIHWR
ncbi:hypothetical protein [Fructilactobacillus florum]|uniref:hypothetical protein n=1 Tax=Fructilactobacillus florum TaxID=640331 RepID=UPI002093BC9C|nr:hypothetical protein [Fructilactobacillus florum]